MEYLHFKIPTNTCYFITRASIDQEMFSLLHDLLYSRNIQLTDELVIYVLMLINRQTGKFAKKCLDCLISFIESKGSASSDDVNCAILTLICDTRFESSSTETLQQIMIILNTVKQISNNTLQVLLHKLILSNKLSDVSVVTMKTLLRRTHLPKILGHTADAIVKYAIKYGMKGKKTLKFILRKSDLKNLGCSRLLYLLKLAIKHKRYAVIRALIFSGSFGHLVFDDRHIRVGKDLCCTVLLMFYLGTGDLDSLMSLMDVPPFRLLHIDMFDNKAFLKSVFSEYSRMDQVAVCTLLKCQMQIGMYGMYVKFDINSLLEKIDRKERQNATFTKNILTLVSQMNENDLYSYGHTLHSLIDFTVTLL